MPRAISRKKSESAIGILGGGIAGLSLAYFLREPKIIILEKNAKVGGLCRSFDARGIAYDIGPHIIFSKNKEALDFLNKISDNTEHKRSNQIFINGKYVKYPFENHLAQMKDKKAIEYCLNAFLNNPYEKMPSGNMLAFFLKTFGEGITKTYLQPYNEKIWKFDPAMMDTQMVDRIPKPPSKDIIRSAAGKFAEGYLHQLYFTYPKFGGMQSVVDGIYRGAVGKGAEIITKSDIKEVRKENGKWKVSAKDGEYRFARLVNCMPLREFISVLAGVPADVISAAGELKYNSINIVIVNVKKDTIGNHFAVMVPDRSIIFHRLSKLDFMGSEYHLANSSTLMLDVTFRSGDMISKMSKEELAGRCIADLTRAGFIKNKSMVNFTEVHREKYAYVIYDLRHRKNTDTVLHYLRARGIESCGRSAEFEYLNSDQVIAHAMELAKKMNASE